MLFGKESSSARGDSMVCAEFVSFLGLLEFAPVGWTSLNLVLLRFPRSTSLTSLDFAELRRTSFPSRGLR